MFNFQLLRYYISTYYIVKQMYQEYIQKRRQKFRKQDKIFRKYTKKHLIELFPRLHLDSYQSVSPNFKQKSQSYTQASKNKRYNKIFSQQTSKQYDNESISTISKYTNDFITKIDSPSKRFIAKEPLFGSIERRSSIDGTYKGGNANKSGRIKDFIEKRNNLYSSIEQNLLQCNKILVKLKKNNQIQQKSKLRRVIGSINYNYKQIPQHSNILKYKTQDLISIKQFLNTGVLNKKQASVSNSKSRYMSYDDIPNQNTKNNYSHQQKRSKSSKLQYNPNQQYAVEIMHPPQYQDSVMEMRRVRINQIVMANKFKTQSLLLSNFSRIKQRGEKLFRKMIKTNHIANEDLHIQ